MIIRPYSTADEAQIDECIIELQEAERLLEPLMAPGEQVVEGYIENLLAECESSGGEVFVAELDEQVAGYVAIYTHVRPNDPDEGDYEYAYLSDIVVRATFQRRGVGRALMDHAEAFVRARGATLLRIQVLARNTAALDLYTSAGFRPREILLEKDLA